MYNGRLGGCLAQALIPQLKIHHMRDLLGTPPSPTTNSPPPPIVAISMATGEIPTAQVARVIGLDTRDSWSSEDLY